MKPSSKFWLFIAVICCVVLNIYAGSDSNYHPGHEKTANYALLTILLFVIDVAVFLITIIHIVCPIIIKFNKLLDKKYGGGRY